MGGHGGFLIGVLWDRDLIDEPLIGGLEID